MKKVLGDEERKESWDASWRMLLNWNGCRFARALRMDSGLGFSLAAGFGSEK